MHDRLQIAEGRVMAPKQIRGDVLALGEKLGLSPERIQRWRIDRPMTEDARQVLANRAKHVNKPHDEPIHLGRGPVTDAEIILRNDSITFKFGPKKAVDTTSPEAVALRRAGGAK
jgi:hypothetical protein